MLQDVHQKEPAGPASEAQTGLARGITELPPAASVPSAKRWLRIGLPGKLLILTAIFVMIAEILIFLPSLASFRINWLNDRITTSQVSAIAADAVPDRVVPPALRNELLRTALVRAIAIRRGGARRVILPPVQPFEIDVSYDLRRPSRVGLTEDFAVRIGQIQDAIGVLMSDGERTMRVIGLLGPRFDDVIEVIMPEEPLRRAMIRYGTEIFWLSFLVALVTAALVYFVINVLLVKPIVRLSRNIVAYGENPEDPHRIIQPSSRSDEIGKAEVELAQMQRQLSQLLQQKNRLAQLGLAVSKINHDLRNMLANTQLISDRLTVSPDPTVQRVAPKLIASLDRAINFCNDTLRFGRTAESAPRRDMIALRPLVEEAGESLGLGEDSTVAWVIDVAPSVRIDADREHLFRILSNLGRNALQALESRDETGAPAGRIRVTGKRVGNKVLIQVADNGPGIPANVRDKLFLPFQASTRRGGTGLGLPIAVELAQAHGGSLTLLETPAGAAFELQIPDRPPAA